MEQTSTGGGRKGVLVGTGRRLLYTEKRQPSETSLEELQALLETAGGECVGNGFADRARRRTRTAFIGEGKADEVRQIWYKASGRKACDF